MAREEVRVDLVANDELTPAAKEAAEALAKLEAEKVEVPVTADTDQAEQGLRRVKDRADDVGKGVKGIGSEADQSRSVLANMAGNATQDLGELGGVAGTSGVAIGQLAEYAAEGNIQMQNLVKTAGPMLALAVAVKVVTGEMEKAKRVDAFNAEQVEAWAAAMREGKTLVDAIAATYEEAGKVETATLFGDIKDVTGDLAELNMTASEFASLVGRGGEATQRWSAAQLAAGADGQAVANVLVAVAQAHENVGASSATAQEQQEVFGRELDETAEAAGRLTDAYDTLTGRLDDESSYLSAQGAIDAVNDALADAMTATAEYGAESEEAQDANRRLAEQLNDSKGQVLDYAGRVAEIPEEQATYIAALIDEGKFAEASAALAELEKTRTAHVRLEMVYGRNRPLGYPASAPWPPTGGAVSTNVTVNLPRGSRPADVMRAVENYARRNGGAVLRR